jgi:hypothetical protein
VILYWRWRTASKRREEPEDVPAGFETPVILFSLGSDRTSVEVIYNERESAMKRKYDEDHAKDMKVPFLIYLEEHRGNAT